MNTSQQRCTNEQRALVSHALADAMAKGQLTTAEFEERSAACWEATYVQDLEALIDDLQSRASVQGAALAEQPASLPPVVQRARELVTGQEGSSSSSIAIFGRCNRSHWVVPALHSSVTVFGGSEIDLSTATFNSENTVINAFAVFGGTEVKVPEGFRIHMRNHPFMGEFDLKIPEGVTDPSTLPPEAPSITVEGFAGFGRVEVKVVPAN